MTHFSRRKQWIKQINKEKEVKAVREIEWQVTPSEVIEVQSVKEAINQWDQTRHQLLIDRFGQQIAIKRNYLKYDRSKKKKFSSKKERLKKSIKKIQKNV